MWRINREAVLLGAGPAALLLQLAHPLVAEGVAHHSRFEEDPTRRLRNTLRTTLALVFGNGAQAERAVARLNGVHRVVQGESLDPLARATSPSYRALDPELLLWVQATLIVSSVEAYERWVGRLDPADRDGFWQEARSVGTRIGIPLERSPVDWDALLDYWRRTLLPDGPIQVSDTARRMGRVIARSPLPGLPGPMVELLMLPSLSMLPPRLREAYGLPFGPGRARLSRLLDLAIRGWVRLLPAGWRSMPQARAAERRVRLARMPASPS
jgi:uncharacterized protein (DUF2236 family)